MQKIGSLVEFTKKLQQEYEIKFLWGTVNLFGSSICAQGTATSPNTLVMAYTAAQVKNAIGATYELDG